MNLVTRTDDWVYARNGAQNALWDRLKRLDRALDRAEKSAEIVECFTPRPPRGGDERYLCAYWDWLERRYSVPSAAHAHGHWHPMYGDQAPCCDTGDGSGARCKPVRSFSIDEAKFKAHLQSPRHVGKLYKIERPASWLYEQFRVHRVVLFVLDLELPPAEFA